MTSDHPDDVRALRQRIEELEGFVEVQRLLGEYMFRCDVVDLSEPADRTLAAERVAELFAEDAIWEGVGRSREEFGRDEGRQAILARFSPRPGPPKFHHNFHLVATPRIVVKGVGANGKWTLLCAVARASANPIWRVARNDVDFAKRDGRWLISHFRAETLLVEPRAVQIATKQEMQ